VAEDQEQASQSAVQAEAIVIRPGRNGNVPPVEHRWKKGQSGNPDGKRLSAELARRIEEEGEYQRLVEALLERARAGDVRAQELVWDRYEGKLVQKSEVDATQRTIVIEAGMDETPDPLEES
jgi:Family of unknown function (DUF5681)